MVNNSTIEPPSKPDRTTVETAPTPGPRTPAIKFIGLKVYLDREGDHVTGHVLFPHVVGGDLTAVAQAYREGKRVTGRTKCPIDYRSKRPTKAVCGTGFLAGQTAAGPLLDDRGKIKLTAVLTYKALCVEYPGTSKLELARRVIEVAKASGVERIGVRSLQLWTRKFQLGGEAALLDRYVKPTRKVPTFDVDHARQALMVCAWWSYRIGNCKTIDTKMMGVAVGLIAGTDYTPAYPLADLIATIDCYYAYDCDRELMPFKSFARWARWHLDLWFSRATRAIAERGDMVKPPPERTPLQTVDRTRDVDAQRSVSTNATRKRQTGNRRTHGEIRKLAGVDAESSPPTSLVEAPETVAEALARLDDKFRCMLLSAAGRNACPAARKAREQASATLPIWWKSMPESITKVLDLHLDQWRKDHPKADDMTANQRRFQMFLPLLRDNLGTERLAVAARITA